MTHMDTMILPDFFSAISSQIPVVARCEAMVVVVSDNPEIAATLGSVCEFLGFQMEHLSTDEDIGAILRRHRPMAVITELDGRGQDGCHVMMRVADHDVGLPIMMLTGDEPGLCGAVDAVATLWNLTGVKQSRHLPAMGQLVEFLFRAGRRGDCVGLMPA